MEKVGGRNNLSILAEEDDEDERTEGSEDDHDGDETDSNTEGEDDGFDQEKRTNDGVPNKFDFLCDGVLSAIALVQEALHELLGLKDKMLQYSLPSTLQMQMGIVSGHLLRSISDMGVPVNELVRMVRVYASPWEEKSAALKKLHDDFDSKQRQLNIAIKRLQLVDAHSKRIAREKRIMNWEKLFSKITNARGHGRRWKFLIDTIKDKAKLGLEHVQAYTQSLDESSESELEEGESSEKTLIEDEKLKSHVSDLEDVKEEDERDDQTEGETSGVKSVTSAEEETESEESQHLTERSMSSSKRVRFEENPTEGVAMIDTSTWTHEPVYDQSLFIRVFRPEGIKYPELKCSLSVKGKMFKTPIFTEPGEDEEENTSETSRRPQAARKTEQRLQSGASAKDLAGIKKKKGYYEFELKVAEDNSQEEPENLKIAVHWGKFEEILAITTIDYAEIKKMSLETVYLTPPHSVEVTSNSRTNSSLSQAFSMDESISDSVDLPISLEETDENTGFSPPKEDLVETSEPIEYPLYSLHIGKSDSAQMPSGKVPLLMYWGKQLRPTHYHRQCCTMGVYDLVFELTGIDLTVITKEDLHKNMSDAALSALSFTKDEQNDLSHLQLEVTSPKDKSVMTKMPANEVRPLSEMDRLVEKHQEEMLYLQEEYERRIQDLMVNMDAMQTDYDRLLQLAAQQQKPGSAKLPVTSPLHRPISESLAMAAQRPTSALSQKSVASKHSFVSGEKPLEFSDVRNTETHSAIHSSPAKNTMFMKKVLPPNPAKPLKNFRIGRPLPKWGEHLPQDFFQRLRLWEEESKQHKEELNSKTLKDIKENLEKKLSGQHKLSKNEEQIYDALKDVSLPALFMPYKRGNIYNPRAYQYFHPAGASDVRLTQPPSMFQLPPLPNSKIPVANLFELSKNFHQQGPAWLVERYIQQQQPDNENNILSIVPEVNSGTATFPDNLTSSSSQRICQIEREVES